MKSMVQFVNIEKIIVERNMVNGEDFASFRIRCE